MKLRFLRSERRTNNEQGSVRRLRLRFFLLRHESGRPLRGHGGIGQREEGKEAEGGLIKCSIIDTYAISRSFSWK